MAQGVHVDSSNCLHCGFYMDCKDHNRFETLVDKMSNVNPSGKMKVGVDVTITCRKFVER